MSRPSAHEHATLERRLVDLCARTASGDAGASQGWIDFTAELEADFGREQAELQRLGRTVDGRRFVARVAADHAAALALLGELRSQARRGELRAATLEVFVDLMREHTLLEQRGSG